MKWYQIAKIRMTHLNLHNKDLAVVLKVTEGAVSHYMTGKRTPTPEQMQKIAKRLDITVDELMGNAVSDTQKGAYTVNNESKCNADTDSDNLSMDEVFIIELFRKMSADEKKRLVIDLMGKLSFNRNYSNHSPA